MPIYMPIYFNAGVSAPWLQWLRDNLPMKEYGGAKQEITWVGMPAAADQSWEHIDPA
jgi:hypothetical protein